MLFRSLIAASAESILNIFLYNPLALNTTRQRLNGKALCVMIKEFSVPITLVFYEKLLKILWKKKVVSDCLVITKFSVLLKLHDYHQITAFVQNNDLVIEGNVKVAKDFISLLNLAEFNLAELFSPYFGDIAAEGVSRCIQRSSFFLYKKAKRLQKYIAEILTEEWRIAPGSLELEWFIKETKGVERAAEKLAMQLKKVEGK